MSGIIALLTGFIINVDHIRSGLQSTKRHSLTPPLIGFMKKYSLCRQLNQDVKSKPSSSNNFNNE